MKISIATSFSRTIQVGAYQPENFFTSQSAEIECQPEDHDWQNKVNQLREGFFEECKKAVFGQIRKRLDEIKQNEVKEKEKAIKTEFDAVSEKAKTGRLSLKEQNKTNK